MIWDAQLWSWDVRSEAGNNPDDKLEISMSASQRKKKKIKEIPAGLHLPHWEHPGNSPKTLGISTWIHEAPSQHPQIHPGLVFTVKK